MSTIEHLYSSLRVNVFINYMELKTNTGHFQLSPTTTYTL